MMKLTQPHLSINNMFPLIGSHSRPPSEDLRGTATNGTPEIQSASRQHQSRRSQHTMEHQRRSPLRSNSLIPSTPTRYLSAAATAAAAAAAVGTVPSHSTSTSPLARSSSFVQNGSSPVLEPTKIIYRSNEYSWNDHPNSSTQALRISSPMKNKLSSSARHLANGTLHENTPVTIGNSTLQIPAATAPQQYSREDMNNVDLLLSTSPKSRHGSRLQRASSHVERTPGPTSYGLPMRNESYRSSRLDYNARGRHNSSRQRNYVTSKSTFHDINTGDFYLTNTQDENAYYHHHQQQQQQMGLLNSSQRINVSAFDVGASRKPLSAAKSNSFHIASNGTIQQNFYNSPQELHRSETAVDRNYLTRFAGRAGNSKEQFVLIPKHHHHHAPEQQTSNTSVANPTIPAGERHPSAKSYKSRDPNVSYAYNDVKKYIEDNDLMPPEKERLIQNWVLDVEKYRHQLQKIE